MNPISTAAALRRREILAAGLVSMLPLAARAQAWPSRPVTLVVPFPAGGSVDLIARLYADPLAKALGTAVVIDNRAGAGGSIASAQVARAKPDGYTLMVQVNTLVMNRSLYRSLSYDPVADFAPVSLTSWGTLLLVTNPNVQKATSVQQMVSAAKAEPGKLTYATPGVGTPHHLSMALLMQGTGTEMLHVPYKGTAGAVTDLLGGRIDYMFLPVHVALQHIQVGKLKAIATGSGKRLPQLPDVPTLAEAGVKGAEVYSWQGMAAPRGLPPTTKKKLSDAVIAAMQDPETKKRMLDQGLEIVASTPEDFTAFQLREWTRWKTLIDTRHITAD